jgi:hypothetical protein
MARDVVTGSAGRAEANRRASERESGTRDDINITVDMQCPGYCSIVVGRAVMAVLAGSAPGKVISMTIGAGRAAERRLSVAEGATYAVRACPTANRVGIDAFTVGVAVDVGAILVVTGISTEIVDSLVNMQCLVSNGGTVIGCGEVTILAV